jgi:hypothetical protein
LLDVIGDAVVTAQYYRRYQTKQFFRPFIERAILVRLRVERKKAPDALVIAAEQLFVHVRAILVKFIH